MIESSLLSTTPRILHGFGTKSPALMDVFEKHWADRAIMRQRHGTSTGIVQRPGQDCGEVDALLTYSPNILLAVMTADCLPLLLAREDGCQVAALHIGWRGALADLVGYFARMLVGSGESIAQWRVAIGPGAGPCCYRFPDEKIRNFKECFPAAEQLLARWPGHLDMPALVHWQLERVGFRQIQTIQACNICHRDPAGADWTFHSYRRDPEAHAPMKDVQWSAIMIDGERKVAMPERSQHLSASSFVHRHTGLRGQEACTAPSHESIEPIDKATICARPVGCRIARVQEAR